ESVQPLSVIWKGSSLASSILGHMSSSSSPLLGWERPGGAVDAESFPFRIERIHYLCPEVTI
ncbi:conserved hypothetical protein, partial [Ricinus communis]